MKKVLLIAICICLVFLVGCGSGVFTTNGMTITLTTEFSEKSVSGVTAVYDSEKIGVLCYKLPFETNPDYQDMTVGEFAEYYREQKSELNPSDVSVDDGVTYVEFENKESDGVNYTYCTTFFVANDGVWTILFFAKSEEYPGLKQTILGYARTVRIGE